MRDRVIETQKAHASQRAEESVLGALLTSDDVRTEILGSGLEAEHFYYRPYRLAFEEVMERYYSDEPIDPLTIAEAVAPKLGEDWGGDERASVDRLVALSKPSITAEVVSIREHAAIVKRHFNYRELVAIASNALYAAMEQDDAPDEIAGALSAAATRLVTGSLMHSESLSYADLGRNWTRAMQSEIAARMAGIDLGAIFGIKEIDRYAKGLRPTELMILGGPSGIGKSALGWAMGRNFAYRQLQKDANRRIGTLILSMEMGEQLSSGRFAQIEGRVDGDTLRTGSLTQTELRAIAGKWAQNRELPLWVNHAGQLRETQIKAIVVDNIRRHNVGLVIIDHFRFIRTDERFDNKNEADDQIVAFLKSTLAKELNIAVVCLAHTIKDREGKRPVMDDLRGSGMISAFADIVAFLYSPWKNASDAERERTMLAREEYEVIFDKVRNGAPGVGEVYMDLSTMTIR